MSFNDKHKIFVFGSNLSGRHGAGAALTAKIHYGAEYGVGERLTGQSYALPTVGHNLKKMNLKTVEYHCKIFIEFARINPQLEFYVTCVGCGLAGFKNEQIAPFFKDAPKNCIFDTKWKPWLGDEANYWGTY